MGTATFARREKRSLEIIEIDVTESEVRDKILSAIWPGHLEDTPDKWQQRKSDRTRMRLVDAAIDCLVEKGYAGLSTVDVAERCSISRGAMHHHFPSRMDLVTAAIEYVLYLRMHLFLDNYFASRKAKSDEAAVVLAAELHWKSAQSREYAAYTQLVVAARTDPALERCFTPLAKNFDDVWMREMTVAFPQWHGDHETLRLASDFVLSAHMGLLINQTVLDDGSRTEKINDLVGEVVRLLYARRIGSELSA